MTDTRISIRSVFLTLIYCTYNTYMRNVIHTYICLYAYYLFYGGTRNFKLYTTCCEGINIKLHILVCMYVHMKLIHIHILPQIHSSAYVHSLARFFSLPFSMRKSILIYSKHKTPKTKEQQPPESNKTKSFEAAKAFIGIELTITATGYCWTSGHSHKNKNKNFEKPLYKCTWKRVVLFRTDSGHSSLGGRRRCQ